MARLPKSGGDDGSWGDILNEFLSVEHNSDGTLKINTNGTVSGKYVKPASGIPESDLSSGVVAKLNTTGGGVPTSRSVGAGTGLTGGGTLASDISLAVAYGTSAGTAAAGNDSRIMGALQSGAAAGGDLSGTLPNPTVAKVNGVAVGNAPSASGQILMATSTTAASWQTPISSSGVVVNVKDSGVVGDGVADDTTNIQTAINNSPAGSTIVFPKGSYLVSSPLVFKGNRQYRGEGVALAGSGGGAQIKVKDGTNLTATGGITGVFVPEAWNNNSTTGDAPVIFENLAISANSTNNSSGQMCGIVLFSHWTRVSGCYISSTNKHGIFLAYKGKDGTTTTTSGTGSENRIFRNHFQSIGDSAVYIASDGISNLDGYCDDNTIQTAGGSAIRLERSSGWSIRRNHTYGIQGHGIYAPQVWGTTISDNYIEDFGKQNTASATYYGIYVNNFGGYGSAICNNTIGCTEPSANSSTYHYIWVEGGGASSSTYNMYTVTGNTMRCTATPTSNARGITFAADPVTIVDTTTAYATMLLEARGNSVSNLIKPTQYLFPRHLRQRPPLSPTAASADWVSHAYGGATATASIGTGAPTYIGAVFFVPADVGVKSTYTAIGMATSGTSAAGTGLAWRLGIYADDGTFGAPAQSVLPLVDAGTLDPTAAAGAMTITFGSPITLSPGRYWLAAMFLATSVTTQTTFVTQGVTPFSMQTLGNNSHRAWYYQGSGTATALPAIASLSRTGINPIVGIKAQ